VLGHPAVLASPAGPKTEQVAVQRHPAPLGPVVLDVGPGAAPAAPLCRARAARPRPAAFKSKRSRGRTRPEPAPRAAA
jgi:hypothetical protein